MRKQMYAYTIHLFKSFKKMISILRPAQALCAELVKSNTKIKPILLDEM